jgi:hypothetical protein
MNPILRTTRNARIPTVQSAIPVPLRPSAADCTILIRDGQYPSNTRTIYGRTRIRVRVLSPSSAADCHRIVMMCPLLSMKLLLQSQLNFSHWHDLARVLIER